jgi:signal transduction histidine kinase/CheY-like chemotaxis protein
MNSKSYLEKTLVWACYPGQLPHPGLCQGMQKLIPAEKWQEFTRWVCSQVGQLENIFDVDFFVDGKLEGYIVQYRDVVIPGEKENGSCKIRIIQAAPKSEYVQTDDVISLEEVSRVCNFQNPGIGKISFSEVVNHISANFGCDFVSILLGKITDLADLGNLDLNQLIKSGGCFNQQPSSFPREHFECAKESLQEEKVSEKHKEFSSISSPLVVGGNLMGVLTMTWGELLQDKEKTLNALIAADFFAQVIELVSFVEFEKSKLAECQINTEGLKNDNWNLKSKNKNKDQYIATLSHDLRTPLSGILASSEILLDEIQGVLNPAQRETTRNIEEAAEHMLSLINDLLDIAKFSEGNVDLQLDWVDMVEIVEGAIRTSSKLFDAKRQNLLVSYQTRNLGVYVDGRRIKQVLINLLSNASNFTSEYGKIELRVSEKIINSIKNFVISVKDSGIGIEKNEIPNLFTPFHQVANKVYVGKPRGSGLGLSIVKELVEAHGGLISIESCPGKGSTFTFSIPIKDKTYSVVLDNDNKFVNNSNSDSGNAAANILSKILIVEDNEVNIIGIAEYLKANRFEILVAHNGREGVEKVIAERPDLVLMDVQMPVMNGIDATRRIREEEGIYFQQLPILMYTALGMPGDEEKCLSSGADEYFMKPFGLKNLVLKINTYINKSGGNLH